jgi:anti-sigma28 factor (negative regulator of flagellin synthesis)
MKINPISTKVILPSDNQVKTTKTEAVPPKDKIQISGLAKSMNTANQEKLQAVKEKMDSGFYNSDEVISKVADEILKEISGE